jgi:hypothetical protein
MNKKYLLATQKFYQDLYTNKSFCSLARNNPFASSIEYGLVAAAQVQNLNRKNLTHL